MWLDCTRTVHGQDDGHGSNESENLTEKGSVSKEDRQIRLYREYLLPNYRDGRCAADFERQYMKHLSWLCELCACDMSDFESIGQTFARAI